MRRFANDSKRNRRRATPIHAYVGANGGGKSLAMVHDTLPSIGMGRPILSTVAIIDPATGEPYEHYRPLNRWHQLLDFRGGDVLMDEVQGVVSSRGHQSLPPAVLNLLLQLRRRDVLLRWSSPDYGRADVALRQVTQAVTYCRGYLPQPDPDGERLWGANRVFYWRTYDALQFDEFTSGTRDQLQTAVRSLYSRTRNGDRAQEWYRTLEDVEHIHDGDESGQCLRCGGTRRRAACKCPREPVRPQRSEDAPDTEDTDSRVAA